jgi:tRNA-dihydrouridine synthase A
MACINQVFRDAVELHLERVLATMTDRQTKSISRKLSVAPMMDWTDRHCRYFHRLFAPHALLYTEMVVSAAIVRGNAARLLAHHPAEHPVALQLGGCDPEELAQAARIGEAAGYAEINLNVGCPSDRVQSGAFGACLMRTPSLVAECVERMRQAVRVPVTVKCRIGVDERDDYEFFSQFATAVAEAGAAALIVHARIAILGGLARPPLARPGLAPTGAGAPPAGAPRLTPKENREIPPLKYDYVHQLKQERPDLPVVINGGFADPLAVRAQLDTGLDGVMLGRAVYHRPALLAELERAVFDPAWGVPRPAEIIDRMIGYAEVEAARGVRLHSIARHMHGLMAGREGARAWRRFLSEVAARPDARPEALLAALPILNQDLAA